MKQSTASESLGGNRYRPLVDVQLEGGITSRIELANQPFHCWRNRLKNKMKWLAVLVMAMGIAACGGGSGGNDVVYDKTITIAEGQQLSVILPAGSYRADITSNNKGVVVSWVAGPVQHRSRPRPTVAPATSRSRGNCRC